MGLSYPFFYYRWAYVLPLFVQTDDFGPNGYFIVSDYADIDIAATLCASYVFPYRRLAKVLSDSQTTVLEPYDFVRARSPRRIRSTLLFKTFKPPVMTGTTTAQTPWAFRVISFFFFDLKRNIFRVQHENRCRQFNGVNKHVFSKTTRYTRVTVFFPIR